MTAAPPEANPPAPPTGPTQRRRWLRPSDPPSRRERVLTFIAAVPLPVLILVIDPIIFRSYDPCGGGLLSAYATFVYILTAISVVTYGVWLIAGSRAAWLGPACAGVFIAAALAGLAVGLAVLPISAIFVLFLGLGLLGLIPLAAAWAYGRAAWRAWQPVAGTALPTTWRLGLAALGFVIALSGAGAMQWFSPLQPPPRPESCSYAD